MVDMAKKDQQVPEEQAEEQVPVGQSPDIPWPPVLDEFVEGPVVDEGAGPSAHAEAAREFSQVLDVQRAADERRAAEGQE